MKEEKLSLNFYFRTKLKHFFPDGGKKVFYDFLISQDSKSDEWTNQYFVDWKKYSNRLQVKYLFSILYFLLCILGDQIAISEIR